MRGTLRLELSDGPLRAEHERLLKTALKRGDADPEATLRGAVLVHEHSEPALIVARRAWAERMKREHHSSTVFSGLLPQLIEAGASLDTKTAVLKMSMDELRHAALCAGVVELLGGVPEVETELATPALPTHDKCTPLERALRNVVFIGCLNETVAIAMLTEERELCREPAIEKVLAQLVADEVWHAKLGWIYLAEVWPKLDETQRERTNAYLPHAFAHLERSLLEPLRGLRFDEAVTHQLNALGLPAPQDMRELFHQATTSAVLPRLDEQGLRATEAWSKRGDQLLSS